MKLRIRRAEMLLVFVQKPAVFAIATVLNGSKPGLSPKRLEENPSPWSSREGESCDGVFSSFLSAALLVIACASFICVTFFLNARLFAQDDNSLAVMTAMENRLVDAIAESERSVVAIARVRRGSIGDPTDPEFVPNQFGTGVVIDKDGLILTNYHVLGDVTENDYYVWIQRRAFSVVSVMKSEKVRAADPWTDLAVLKIDANDLQPIRFGDTTNLKKGQIVMSLGNPYAIARDGQPSASWGIISNLSRKATRNPTALRKDGHTESLHAYGTLIQTDARLNLGTSGGALINLRGEMIGLTTSLAAMEKYETAAGFAIPVDDVFLRVIDALKNGEQPEFGFLGIAPSNLAASARRSGAIGVEIENVVAGSPAACAKLEVGDIITHVDGKPIHDKSHLMAELSSRDVETRILVSIVRDQSSAMEIPVQLSKKRIESVLPSVVSHAPMSWRGIQVEFPTATKDYLEVSSLVDEKGCVSITSVELDSPAWKAGLRAGQIVSHAGGRRIATPREFFSVVGEIERTEPEGKLPQVLLTVIRSEHPEGVKLSVLPPELLEE